MSTIVKDAQIKVVDNAVRPSLANGISELLQSSRWEFGHKSTTESKYPFWSMPLDDEVLTIAILQELKVHFAPDYPTKFRIIRVYANGQLYGIDGVKHQDAECLNDFTVLYYANPIWEPQWGGATVFLAEDDEIVKSVLPKPNRAVIFPATSWHFGQSPTRDCPELRMCIAFKLHAK